LPDALQHLLCMPARADPVQSLTHDTLSIDQEGRAQNRGTGLGLSLSSVLYRPLLHDVAGKRGVQFGVRQQPDRQTMPLTETAMAFDVVPTYPEDGGTAVSKSSRRSLNSIASIVQPGVSSFG